MLLSNHNSLSSLHVTMAGVKALPLKGTIGIPTIGLGTWQSPPGQVRTAVESAIRDAGYRHIDGAWMYGNEKEVGEAIRASGVPREEIFITGKLPSSRHSKAAEALNESLADLGTSYLDLYLIHWPVSLNPYGNDPKVPTRPDGTRDIFEGWTIEQTWKEMVDILATGKVKAIGVSNFSIHFLKKLEKLGGIQPQVNQIEIHPYLPQHDVVEYCQSKGIIVEAYSPLGSTASPILEEPEIVEIAKKHGASSAGVLLSWLLSKDIVVLPKSVTPARIASNITAAKVPLTAEEIKQIDTFSERNNKLKRFGTPPWGVPLGFKDWGFLPDEE
ncbi:NADP-dependent oxidoreductase domain-containing protein [Mrakia frigida]|uniref:aldo/keto reductase family protein n=1 Tax=Mrakia frigida TaxID=29902 RepID=UPI003FCC26EA